jgi:hypothetical protein
MIKLRIFNKETQQEFAKYFINEYCAMKFKRKLRYSKKLQVIGEMEYVKVQS